MPICWTKPDGSVRLMQLSPKFLADQALPGETTAETVARLAPLEQAKNPDLADATFTLVTTANTPAERANRHKWRLRNGRVEVDAAVPDPPNPKQALLDAIEGATNLAQLKAAVKNLVSAR